VLRFPAQSLDVEVQKAFASRFGTLEINVAGSFQDPDHREVMILSNMVEDGRPIGLADAGQGWHTDMSYSEVIAMANILYAIKVPRENGRSLGATQFANMHAAYDDLPQEVKVRLEGATAVHDFEKFWEMMRHSGGSERSLLSEEQRRRKPPVSHSVFLTHPITGRRVLYANPGYTVRINGFSRRESDDLLAFLFEHQLRPDYIYEHQWTEGDLLVWDDIGTLHKAVADYGPHQHRLMRRCQAMADRFFVAPTTGNA
jgi:taurine dioxygenase